MENIALFHSLVYFILLLIFWSPAAGDVVVYSGKSYWRSNDGKYHRKSAGFRRLSDSSTGICSRTVDSKGSGDFITVQSAVDSVPVFNTLRFVICIKAGIYTEKVMVPPENPYIIFQGEGRDVTKITWHDKSSDIGSDGQPLGTYNTPSVAIFASNFVARNISFVNTAALKPIAGEVGWQAVAFRISGDQAYFAGCGFYGAQDTLLDERGRHYLKECYIEGSIDFIFGNGRSVYKECELHSIATDWGAIAAHGRASLTENSGFSFVGCRVTGNGPVYVGRAMGQYSTIIYGFTEFNLKVRPDSWDPWTSGRENTAYFGYYECSGDGASAMAGVKWAHSLTHEEAYRFLSPSFVNAEQWIATVDI